MNLNNNKVQVYKHKTTNILYVVFRQVCSKAINNSNTLQAIDFNYKGKLIKENSLNIYYSKVDANLINYKDKQKLQYIIAGYKPQ